MDLLAPAGTIESFYAAIENGADAVYVGLKNFSARAYAKNFTPAELALLLPYARKKGVKINIALNALAKESELPETVRTLAILNELQPDAVIIQDIGMYHLITSHFSRLTMHGSVLMTVHNSLGARQLYEMGFKRVVLAREMSLEEIAAVRKSCPIDLEVFVHGALCYSYSGLCLFSSYLGGRGSTRGRCTQPCRRRYKGGKRAGYFFSPSDLSAVDILPELKKLGITAIKIEGRMRSATYVAAVVKAYRLALDALETAHSKKAIDQARKLLKESMGRRLSNGFYRPASGKDILTPHVSGNIGQFVGKVTHENKNKVTICVKKNLAVGDRIRAHFPETDERMSATLRRMKIRGESAVTAKPGQTVTLTLPFRCPVGTTLFKVDSASPGKALSPQKIWEEIKKSVRDTAHRPRGISISKSREILSSCTGHKHPGRKPKETLILRFNLKQHVPDRGFLSEHRLIINLSKNDWRRFSRTLSAYRRRSGTICWSLPAIIHEKDINFFKKLTAQLLKKGFHNWEITNLGHLQFFKKSGVTLHAGHQINLLNSCAFKAARKIGMTSGVVSIEADRNDIKDICQQLPFSDPIITVYGHPPVFTSRLMPKDLKNGQSIVSARQERYRFSIADDIGYLIPQQPFSLIPFKGELTKMGCVNFIIDLSHEAKPAVALSAILNKRYWRKCSCFNYKRTLQ